MTIREIKKQFKRPPSFINQLPFVNYNPDDECFLLNDGVSVGAVLEVSPIDAESRPEEMLVNDLLNLAGCFSTFMEYDFNPWVVQIYVNDEPVDSLYFSLKEYTEETSPAENAVRDHYLEAMRKHLSIISRSEGLFDDSKSGSRWHARYRRVRVVIYRRADTSLNRAIKSPANELTTTVNAFRTALAESGVSSTIYTGADLYCWLYPWFNPQPRGFDSAWDYLLQTKAHEQAFDWDYDLASGIVADTPRNENGHWYFNGLPNHYVPIIGFPDRPKPGKMTLETRAGDATTEKSTAAILDRLPYGCTLAITIVIKPQDHINSSLETIKGRGQGGGTHEALAATQESDDVQDAMRIHKLYPASMGLYVTAEEDDAMQERLDQIFAICNTVAVL